MTGDAGDRERSSRIPGWDGEADTYFSCARRARQCVEGAQIQARYLRGSRLEAQLTGRAESAVVWCRPGWLLQERGVETLLPFFRTLCAQHALGEMGSHFQAFFNKSKKEEARTDDQLVCTIQERVHHCQTGFERLQRVGMTQNCTSRTHPHRMIMIGVSRVELRGGAGLVGHLL